MTDITELAQSLKAAAEKATPGRIGDRIDGSGSIKYQCLGNDGSLVLQTDHKNMEYGFTGPNAEDDELFFRECAPENILALVEALESEKRICSTWRKTAESTSEKLEKAQQYIKERDEENEGLMLTVGRLRVEREALESRTVNVKLPTTIEPIAFSPWVAKAFCQFHKDTVKSCFAVFSDACAAAGIKVEVE